jgi:DDE superfamily endonuclease
MAKAMGLSAGSVQGIWRAHNLQPHRLRTFKRSHDPRFEAKLTDIVDLNLDLPGACRGALARREKPDPGARPHQPGLPIKPRALPDHDARLQAPQPAPVKAGGTTTLFAALSVLDETVIGRYMQLHRHREFICFLNAVEREVPAEKPVHAALDNYTTHKHPKVLTWLSRYPSWTFHLTPTSASSLNVVEDFLFLNDPPTHPPWRAPLDRRFAGRDHAVVPKTPRQIVLESA